MPRLSRTPLLLLALLAVGVVDVAWHVASGWGKVTLHVRNAPLSKVATSIASQGHIRLRTNLDPATPVTLDCDRVTVAEALEDLSIVTEARWRLTYLVGPRKQEFKTLLDGWAAGQPDPAWRWIDRPLPGLDGFGGPGGPAPGPDGDDAPPDDPRRGTVSLQTAATASDGQAIPPLPTEMQGVVERAALFADVQAVIPTDWNPTVGDFSKQQAEPASLFAKLAGAGHGASQEVFLLSRRGERRFRPPVADGDVPPTDNAPPLIEAALQARVDRLPPDRRAGAQAALDERKELAKLSPDERRARRQKRMNDPAFQELMQDRMLDREDKQTPEQREQRFSRYVAGKAAATGR